MAIRKTENTCPVAPRTLTAIESMDAMWALVDTFKAEILATKPPQGFTLVEYVERYFVHRKTATDRLEALIAKGKIKKQKVRIYSGGAHRVTNIYTPVEIK